MAIGSISNLTHVRSFNQVTRTITSFAFLISFTRILHLLLSQLFAFRISLPESLTCSYIFSHLDTRISHLLLHLFASRYPNLASALTSFRISIPESLTCSYIFSHLATRISHLLLHLFASRLLASRICSYIFSHPGYSHLVSALKLLHLFASRLLASRICFPPHTKCKTIA